MFFSPKTLFLFTWFCPDIWLGHDDTEAFIKLQSSYRTSMQHSEDSDQETREDEEYLQKRGSSSDSDNQEHSPVVVSSNPFALLDIE